MDLVSEWNSKKALCTISPHSNSITNLVSMPYFNLRKKKLNVLTRDEPHYVR